MNLISEIVDSTEATKVFRQHLHRYPELGYEVHATADFVAERLTAWGIPVTRGVGKTGLVGTLKRGTGVRSIGLRADMDALPVSEANTFRIGLCIQAPRMRVVTMVISVCCWAQHTTSRIMADSTVPSSLFSSQRKKAVRVVWR